MSTFEEGFAATEQAADSVLQALGDVSRLARQLQRDAKAGNIAGIRRGTARLEESLGLIREQVGNAARAWPFAQDDEPAYLQNRYAAELQEVAGKNGLQLFERDGRLIAHPSVLRVLPGERAVRIDRRQSSAIRPTKIVADLAKLQRSPPRFRHQPFLESLYSAYLALAQSDTADRLQLGGVGQVVRLDRIYNLFTGLPGARREYSQLDFARDLYSLESSGVNEVRSGSASNLPGIHRHQKSQGDHLFRGTKRRTHSLLWAPIHRRQSMTSALQIQDWLGIIRGEYLCGFVKDGGSAVKFVVPSREDLGRLLELRLTEMASALGYVAVKVDAGETRVHMPQEIFFRIAEQIDWRTLARRVVLKLCRDLPYRTDGIDPAGAGSILEAISAANDVEESQIALDLRRVLPGAVTRNRRMSRDFRVAMTHLCLTEMGGEGQNPEAMPLLEWWTGPKPEGLQRAGLLHLQRHRSHQRQAPSRVAVVLGAIRRGTPVRWFCLMMRA